MKLRDDIQGKLTALERQHLRRRVRTVDTPCSPHIRIEDRDLLAFCSNDYLGLANHPALIAAMAEGAQRYGVGSGAAHLVSGHSRAHALLGRTTGRHAGAVDTAGPRPLLLHRLHGQSGGHAGTD